MEIRGANGRLDSPGVILPDFAVLRIFANYRVCDNFEIFGRVENVLDEEFESTSGFRSPGTAAYVGARIRF